MEMAFFLELLLKNLVWSGTNFFLYKIHGWYIFIVFVYLVIINNPVI